MKRKVLIKLKGNKLYTIEDVKDFVVKCCDYIKKHLDDLEMGEGGDFSQDALTEEQLAELLEKSADLDLAPKIFDKSGQGYIK